MFHLLAYGSNSVDASAGNVQLNAIAEQVFNRANNSFQMPQSHYLLLASAAGLDLSRARLNTGSLRSRGFPQIFPVNITEEYPSRPGVMDLRPYPILLRDQEDVRVDITNAAAGAANVGLWVSPTPPNLNINYRDVRAIRFTASVTAVDTGWSNPGTMSFEDTLEGGTYAVYGMVAQGANIIFARIIFQDQVLRPGCIGNIASGDIPSSIFMGGMGKWGQFSTYSPPQIETLETAAGASSIVGWLLTAKVN